MIFTRVNLIVRTPWQRYATEVSRSGSAESVCVFGSVVAA